MGGGTRCRTVDVTMLPPDDAFGGVLGEVLVDERSARAPRAAPGLAPGVGLAAAPSSPAGAPAGAGAPLVGPMFCMAAGVAAPPGAEPRAAAGAPTSGPVSCVAVGGAPEPGAAASASAAAAPVGPVSCVAAGAALPEGGRGLHCRGAHDGTRCQLEERGSLEHGSSDRMSCRGGASCFWR